MATYVTRAMLNKAFKYLSGQPSNVINVYGKPVGTYVTVAWVPFVFFGRGITLAQAGAISRYLSNRGYVMHKLQPSWWIMKVPVEEREEEDPDTPGPNPPDSKPNPIPDPIYQLYQGDGSYNTWGLLTVGDCYFDHVTDAAGILAICKDAALRLRARRSNSDIFDDAVAESWATQAYLAAKLIADLKIMKNILRINPQLTCSDVTAGLPLARGTLRALLFALKDIRFPQMAYALAEPFTRVIQLSGEQDRSSIEGSFFVPWNSSLTQTTANDLIALIENEYDSAAFASQIKQPLVSLSERWIENMHVVPYFSDWALLVCVNLPTKIEDSGVTEYNQILGKADVDVSMQFSEFIGFGEAINCCSIFRSVVDDVGFTAVNDPAAGDVSLLGLAGDGKTFVPIVNTDEDYRFLHTLAQGLAIGFSGIVTSNCPGAQKVFICQGDTALDRKFSGHLTEHAFKPGFDVFTAKKKLLKNRFVKNAGVKTVVLP